VLTTCLGRVMLGLENGASRELGLGMDTYPPYPQVPPDPPTSELEEAVGEILDDSALTPAQPSDLDTWEAQEQRRVRETLDEELVASTRRRYADEWRRFVAWCARGQRTPLPADVDTVLFYLNALGKPQDGNAPRAQQVVEPMSMATIRIALAAIRFAHLRADMIPPTIAAKVKREVRSLEKRLGVAPRRKVQAATGEVMRGFMRHPRPGLLGLRDRALLGAGFAGALRRSEIVALDMEDVTATPGGYVLRIRRSKTDQAGRGADVTIGRSQDPAICPVRALATWIGELHARAIKSGPLFVYIDRHGNIRAARPGGSPRLTPEAVALVVQHYARATGLDITRFAGHSLRSGFATTAVHKGRDLDAIKKQTRHRKTDTLMEYVRSEEDREHPVSEDLL